MIERIKNFFIGVVFEMRKVSWPSWEELKGSTIVVLVLSGVLAVFLLTVDTILVGIVGALLR
ncbi:MAG: preprotein translocase subunit SecE [Candidatus Marinimicrobia bacterium]|nr:preprotein translocase subunit SecE [Candidatus Neomarinimicrobiota bacterium]